MSQQSMRSICVYCGSASGASTQYVEAARALGTGLATAGIALVYGGGRVGLMGALADAALEGGGQAYGVIPQLLVDKEIAHRGLSKLTVVDDMHQRKRHMADLADAFVVLPGGSGTLEEFFEVYTWAQLGYHAKPIALLNVGGFYDPLLAMLRHTVEQGFMQSRFVDMLIVQSDVEALLEACRTAQPGRMDKWSERRNAV